MFKKFLKIFIAVLICVCVAGSTASVLAKTEIGTTEPPIDKNNVSGSGNGLGDTTAPPETTPPSTTETITTQPETSEEEEEEEEEQEEEQEEENEEEETTEETTENDGSFKVYLDLNGGKMENGKTFLTCDMSAPGLVGAPEEPTKVGYLFDGWYSDEALTKEWDFTSNFAFEEMTIYAKWVRDPAAILYDISVIAGKGGKITVRPEKAAVGETVLIMVQPEEGMRLKKGSLLINGEPSDILSFEMPAGPVVVEAEFELTPVEEQKKDNSVIIVACVAVAIIVAIVFILIMVKRRNTIIVPEFDEDGAIIIEDDEEVWIDESIVVESGFREGKKASDINPPKIEDFENTISIDDLNKQ